MLLLNVDNIDKEINELKILKNISFKLYSGDKIGIIGKNGCGKTTLIKIITGIINKDRGSISIYGNMRYLPQNLIFKKNMRVKNFLSYNYNDPNLMNILQKLNLNNLINQNMSTLSGGEKTKLYLAKIISKKPDILLLDEPTNNLDWSSIEIVEKYINNFKGGVIVISHDRLFLDNTISTIYELDNKSLKKYSGNYSFYYNTKQIEKERTIMEYNKYKKQKRKLEEAARKHMQKANNYNNMSKNDFQRHKAAKIAKRSKAIISRIENMEKKDRPYKAKKINIKIDNKDKKTSNILIKAYNISKSFNQTIFSNVSFEIKKNNKIALIGDNGTGKTTILKAILGNQKITGEIYISPSTKIGYFSQDLEILNWENTIIEEIKLINNDETYIRTILGSMLFRKNDIYKKIKNLSFGEKVRVAFAKLILENNNLLLLDEPTNFLDIPTSRAIEKALINYNGAILFASHDRFFIKKLAKEIWELKNGNFKKFLGGYDYYTNKNSSNNYNVNDNKEEILKLEMKLSHLSFKLFNCPLEKKESLEKEYFKLSNKLNKIKK